MASLTSGGAAGLRQVQRRPDRALDESDHFQWEITGNQWFGVSQLWRNTYASHSPTFSQFKPGFKSCYHSPYAEVVVQSAEKNAVELNAAQIGTDALLLSLLTVPCSFEVDGRGVGADT